MERQGLVPEGAPLSEPPAAAAAPVEALVADARAGVTPAQMVEQKLASLATGSPLLMSRLRSAGLRRPLD
jgi:hypothetical protein